MLFCHIWRNRQYYIKFIRNAHEFSGLDAGKAQLFKPFGDGFFIQGCGRFPFAHRANNPGLVSAPGQTGNIAAEHALK
jgi:hypothetical protein